MYLGFTIQPNPSGTPNSTETRAVEYIYDRDGNLISNGGSDGLAAEMSVALASKGDFGTNPTGHLDTGDTVGSWTSDTLSNMIDESFSGVSTTTGPDTKDKLTADPDILGGGSDYSNIAAGRLLETMSQSDAPIGSLDTDPNNDNQTQGGGDPRGASSFGEADPDGQFDVSTSDGAGSSKDVGASQDAPFIAIVGGIAGADLNIGTFGLEISDVPPLPAEDASQEEWDAFNGALNGAVEAELSLGEELREEIEEDIRIEELLDLHNSNFGGNLIFQGAGSDAMVIDDTAVAAALLDFIPLVGGSNDAAISTDLDLPGLEPAVGTVIAINSYETSPTETGIAVAGDEDPFVHHNPDGFFDVVYDDLVL